MEITVVERFKPTAAELLAAVFADCIAGPAEREVPPPAVIRVRVQRQGKPRWSRVRLPDSFSVRSLGDWHRVCGSGATTVWAADVELNKP